MRGVFLGSLVFFGSIVAGSMVQAGQERASFTIEERAKDAELVVVGKVKKRESFRAKNSYGDELIMTKAQLEVAENMKGEAGETVDVVIEGGTVDGLTLRVSDLPEVQDGDEYIAFLERGEEGLRPHLRGLGLLPVEKGTRKIRNSSLTVETVREKVRR